MPTLRQLPFPERKPVYVMPFRADAYLMLPDRTHQHDCAAADDGPAYPQDDEGKDVPMQKKALTADDLRKRYTKAELKAELRRRGYKIPRGPNFTKPKRRK